MSKVNSPIIHFDFEDSRGYLDQPEFASYTAQVHTSLRQGNQTIREIKQSFEGNHRYLFDALEVLTGAGDAFLIQELTPMRWVSSTAPVKVKGQFIRENMTIPPKNNIPYGRGK